MQGKGLACSGGSDDGHIRIFIDPRIEDIDDNQAVVELVDTEQDPVLIRHLIAREGVAACCGRSKHIPLAALEQFLIQFAKGHDCGHRLLLTESAYPEIHVLGDHQALDLSDPPLQVFQCVRRHRDENNGVIEILVICQALFQVVPGPDGILDVIVVGVGIGGVLDPAAVDADLLAEFCLDALFRLPLEVDVNVDPLTGVDKDGCPAGNNAGIIAVGGDHEVGVVQSIHDGIAAVLEINALRGDDPRNGKIGAKAVSQVIGLQLLDPLLQRGVLAGLTIENGVEDLQQESILVIVGHHDIVAVQEVLLGCPGGSLKR